MNPKPDAPGCLVDRHVRLVDPHDARIEALDMFPLPSLMERRAWAEDWIRSNIAITDPDKTSTSK